MSDPYEIIGTIFGLLSVWLTIKKSVWCWPTGLANVVLFFIMFYQVKLYAELITYGMFFVLGVYGWWEWVYGGEDHTELPVSRTPRRMGILIALVALVWIPAQGYVLSNYTDASVPYWDSAITVFSLVAQWMLARKYLENWVLWISVDILAIGVYWYKDLHVATGLYVVFLIMAVSGLIAWWRGFNAEGEAGACRNLNSG